MLKEKVQNLSESKYYPLATFVGGVVLGGLGITSCASKKGRRALTKLTACGLRVKDGIMDGVDRVQAEAEDIVAEAKEINQAREVAEAAPVFEDDEIE